VVCKKDVVAILLSLKKVGDGDQNFGGAALKFRASV
jgi:hypothetical protein